MNHRLYTALRITVPLCLLLNALSYFYRGDGDLFDSYIDDVEAIGFPLQFWKRGGFAGVYYVSWPSVIVDVVAALALCCVVAWLLESSTSPVDSRAPSRRQSDEVIRVSVRFILLWITYVAVLIGIARMPGLAKPVFVANQLLTPTLLWVCRQRLRRVSAFQVTVIVLFVVGTQIAVGLVVGHAFLGYFLLTCLVRIYVASVLVYAGLLAGNCAYQWWRSTGRQA